MKYLLFIFLAALIYSCNSSSSRKDTGNAGDDTLITENGPVNSTASISFEPVKISASQIPTTVKFKGKLNEAWQWTDKLGENILVTSFVDPYDDKEKNDNNEDGQTAELYATLFLKKGDIYLVQWQVDEMEKSCPFDITCYFIKNATTVTDIDKDGIAETTIQYRHTCRSDVSPAEMKLVMHEDVAMYYLQGLSWVKVSDEDRFNVNEKNANLETLPGYRKTDEEYMETFGRYESEKEFAGAPPEFLAYARKQWMKFVIETFE